MRFQSPFPFQFDDLPDLLGKLLADGLCCVDLIKNAHLLYTRNIANVAGTLRKKVFRKWQTTTPAATKFVVKHQLYR